MKTETLMLITDARHVLRKTAAVEAASNPLAAAFLAWLLREDGMLAPLEEAAVRAAAAKGADRNSRNVAVLGLACGIEPLKSKFGAAFAQQLEWLMGRPNIAAGGEPCGVVADPLNFAGVVAGAEIALASEARKRFDSWATTAWKDADALIGSGNWRRGLLNSLGARIGAANGNHKGGGEPMWLAAGLQRRGWGTPAETSGGDVLKAALNDAAAVMDGFEAGLRLAAIDWSLARAMDFDVNALTVGDVAGILQRVPTVFQRWTWEDKPRTGRRGAEPRRWHIENEYHFQSVLYAVLKPLITALEEEQYVAPTGTYQPRADLCILALELVVEVKFWYLGKSVKDLTEEIAADMTLYLRPGSPYRKVIAVIWDDGGRTEEQAELKRGVKGFNGMIDVVIVNRPAYMRAMGESNAAKEIRPPAAKKSPKAK